MSNLKQRVEKLEKAQGAVPDFDDRLRKYCDQRGWDHKGYEGLRDALKGHESELHIDQDGGITYEGFLVIVRCVCPEVLEPHR
jgi:hypothetical protein